MSNQPHDLLQMSLSIADKLRAEESDSDLAARSDSPTPLASIAKIAEYYSRVHMPLARTDAGQEPLRWGHLELLEILGSGTDGVVYRALDPHLQREVALKVLAGSAHDAGPTALDEARRLAALDHPNIVTIYGADIQDGRAGFWMELITGHTLDRVLATQGLRSERQAVAIGIEICRALVAIHQAGILHRDLKPANVMCEYDGRILLMDLGIGVPHPGEGDGYPARGTPLYCDPVVLGGGQPSAAGDIYGLGVMLDHMVSGSYPLTGASLEDLRSHAAGRSVSPLRRRRPDLDEGFLGIVERATCLDPAGRYRSADECLQALIDWSDAKKPVERGSAGKRPEFSAVLAKALVPVLVLLILSGLLYREVIRPPAPLPIVATASMYLASASPPRVLDPGSLVRPGDRLFLNLEANQPLHIYVLNEDDTGNVFLLYPSSDKVKAGPLPAGTTRLPVGREGEPYAWTVSSAGGQEHFLVVGSPDPLPLLEEFLADVPPPAQGDQVQFAYRIPSAQTDRLRGVGILAPDPSTVTAGADSSRIARAERALAAFRKTKGSAIWVRRIDLANPR